MRLQHLRLNNTHHGPEVVVLGAQPMEPRNPRLPARKMSPPPSLLHIPLQHIL